MNHYEVLGVSKDATKEEIRKAYAKKIRECPPNENRDEFSKIQDAYDILGDDKKRNNYNNMIILEVENETLFQEGIEKLKSCDYEGALKIFKKLSIIHPCIIEINRSLAFCYINVNNYSMTKEILKNKVNPYLSNSNYSIDEYFELSNYALIIEDFQLFNEYKNHYNECINDENKKHAINLLLQKFQEVMKEKKIKNGKYIYDWICEIDHIHYSKEMIKIFSELFEAIDAPGVDEAIKDIIILDILLLYTFNEKNKEDIEGDLVKVRDELKKKHSNNKREVSDSVKRMKMYPCLEELLLKHIEFVKKLKFPWKG